MMPTSYLIKLHSYFEILLEDENEKNSSPKMHRTPYG